MADAPAAERIERVDLVEDELDRDVVGADLSEHGRDGGNRLGEALLGQRSVRDVKPRSATRVSSSVAAKPSTSWVGSRRMKPTCRHEVALPVVLERPCRRIERLEQAVVTDACAPVSAFSRVDLPTFV